MSKRYIRRLYAVTSQFTCVRLAIPFSRAVHYFALILAKLTCFSFLGPLTHVSGVYAMITVRQSA